MTDGDFRRARRPEQIAERRATILAVAREMLAEHRLAEISLRELSGRVGLAKSNVLRYFESREAIFLELLDEEWRSWLDDLEATPGTDSPLEIARTLTVTLANRPLLCELFSTLAGVLEHNISVDCAREFKAKASANAVRLREWVRAGIPSLDEASAHHFAGAVAIIAGGLWGYERPSPSVAQVARELGGLPDRPFSVNLLAGLHAHLVGVVTLAAG